MPHEPARDLVPMGRTLQVCELEMRVPEDCMFRKVQKRLLIVAQGLNGEGYTEYDLWKNEGFLCGSEQQLQSYEKVSEVAFFQYQLFVFWTTEAGLLVALLRHQW